MSSVSLPVGENPSLFFLRGVAVFAVVLFHTHIAGRYFFPVGWMGVDLFFVISGFLVTASLSQSISRYGYKTGVAVFFIKRFFRIFPALFVMLLVVFGVSVLFLGRWPVLEGIGAAALFQMDIYHILARMPFIPEVSHTWSLAVEEKFYLLLPLLFFVAARQKLKVAACLILAGMVGLLSRYSYMDWRLWWPGITPLVSWGPYFFFPCRLDGLVLGSLLYLSPQFRRMMASFPVLILACLLFLSCLELPTYGANFDNWFPVDVDGRQLHVFGYLAIALAFTSVVARAVEQSSCFSALPIIGEGLTTMGRYSYALYLVHCPIISWCAFYLARPNTAMNMALYDVDTSLYFLYIAISCFLSLVVALPLYWYCEQPGYLFGKTLARAYAQNRTCP